jgi:ADP-ribosyl-[dinitrogen reductase] hydrolase
MKGSCACGSIQYELNDRFLIVNHCHCSTYRKVHGAAFGTFGHAKAEAFRWIQGEALLTGYRSSEGNVQNFCRVCGAHLPSVFPEINYVRVPLATLDDDPHTQPICHSYVKSKVSWFEIADSLTQYPESVDLRELVQV